MTGMYLSSTLLQGAAERAGSVRRAPAAEVDALVIRHEMDLPRFRGEVRSWDQGIWFDGILSSSFE